MNVLYIVISLQISLDMSFYVPVRADDCVAGLAKEDIMVNLTTWPFEARRRPGCLWETQGKPKETLGKLWGNDG